MSASDKLRVTCRKMKCFLRGPLGIVMERDRQRERDRQTERETERERKHIPV